MASLINPWVVLRLITLVPHTVLFRQLMTLFFFFLPLANSGLIKAEKQPDTGAECWKLYFAVNLVQIQILGWVVTEDCLVRWLIGLCEKVFMCPASTAPQHGWWGIPSAFCLLPKCLVSFGRWCYFCIRLGLVMGCPAASWWFCEHMLTLQ